MAEWNRQALESLRQPLESGVIGIARASMHCLYPARFQLVAAMNPCPCGWAGDPSGRCRCTEELVQRYRARLSGPLLDRIDLQVLVPRMAPTELRSDAARGESTSEVRERVLAARARQLARTGRTNATLDQAETERDCRLAAPEQNLLEHAMASMMLSARATLRILRVARTIADLAESPEISATHLLEAIGFRQLDRGAGANLPPAPKLPAVSARARGSLRTA